MFEEAEYSFPVAEDTSVDDAVGMGPRPPFSRGQDLDARTTKEGGCWG